jgi:hypothetical protein
VLVRAGALTPQFEDEVLLRGLMVLPDAGQEIKQAWIEDGGVRRPITIAPTESGDTAK